VLGVDTPSTDYAQSTTFPVHVVLGTANIPAMENVANLDMIPEKGATIFAAPIKLFDGSGGPARVFAIKSVYPVGASAAISPNALVVVWFLVLAFLLTKQ